MKKDNYLDLFDSKQKAIDHAIWLNFKYRIAKIKFGVISGPENNWAVCEEATPQEMEMAFLDILPKNYTEMTYDEIRHIRMDNNPLPIGKIFLECSQLLMVKYFAISFTLKSRLKS